jgi:hypothetical protein
MLDASVLRLVQNPRAEWAKHRARARKDMQHLLRSWLLTGKWHYFFLLLSDTGNLLIREKYSAFAIDRVYANEPSGWGWLGRRLDRYVLGLPVHCAVRERFAFVTQTLRKVVRRRLAASNEPVAVLSAPCGLVRDLCSVYASVCSRDAAASQRLVFYGFDLDYEGCVLEEARRRATTTGLPLHLVQANLLDEAPWRWLEETSLLLSLVNCIGLAPWLSPQELTALLQRFAEHLCPGGYVLLDRFNRGRHSKLGEGAEIVAHYHTAEAYQDAFQASGLVVQACKSLGDGEGLGYLLQKPG